MIKDISNQRFGRLLAIEPTGEKRWGVTIWRCICDCGAEKTAAVNSLKSGLVQSCGCLLSETARKRKTTHGMYKTPVYQSWDSMIQRCTNPATKKFSDYGGRGIAVCERWLAFENFYADMGDRPEGHTLDRINVNGNYEPGNCRWATAKQQSRNKRTTKLSEEIALRVRTLYIMGMGPRKIAKEVGCSHFSVCGILFMGEWMPDD
jgi:hypothetical protein